MSGGSTPPPGPSSGSGAPQNVVKLDVASASDAQIDQALKDAQVIIRQPLPKTLADDLPAYEKNLERFWGQQLIGLAQKTLPSLDRMSLGLRGFVLLAAPPNVGKTALAVQLGTDILSAHPEALFVFVSLEMDRFSIYDRLLTRKADLFWSTLKFGSQPQGAPTAFSQGEWDRLQEGLSFLREVGDRMVILDKDTPGLRGMDAHALLEHIKTLHEQHGTTRTFILIDYLQLWMTPPEMDRGSDLERDKYRIAQMLELRDHLGTEEACVMVISEARKPGTQKGEMWGSDLADVMGSARGSYSPDAVFLFQAAAQPDLARHLGLQDREAKEKKALILAYVKDLQHDGLALMQLHIKKGRDGWEKGGINLTYQFFKNDIQEGWPRDPARLTRIEAELDNDPGGPSGGSLPIPPAVSDGDGSSSQRPSSPKKGSAIDDLLG